MNGSVLPSVQTLALLATCCLGLVAGCGQKTDSLQSSANPAVPETQQSVATSSNPVASLSEESTNKGVVREPPKRRQIQDSEFQPDDEPQKPSPRRMADDQPEINPARLTAVGIQRYESKRLVLLTDLPANRVAGLTELVDQLFGRLEQYFGKLPPALDGSVFRVTGCVIGDVERFKSAGLMPSESFGFSHGRHLNYQFWCYAQETDYYLRHLVLHEFTHCFMTCESGLINIPPLWYVEGMAEYFATHRIPQSGQPEFAILPEAFDGFEGWGRISEMDREFQRSSSQTTKGLPDALAIPSLSLVMRDVVLNATGADYAKWWALNWMLQTNPNFKSVFAPLRKLHTREEFIAQVHRIRDSLGNQLSVDWLLFAESLTTGFDSENGFPVHCEKPLVLSQTGLKAVDFPIAANREWQDSGIRLQAGDSVTISCEGRYSINEPSADWVSEPQGVGIEYYRGLPVGLVVATLVDANGIGLSRRIPIGRNATITAANDSAIWLQINDSSSSRANNLGEVDVSVSVAE